jgi:hypothetical protein
MLAITGLERSLGLQKVEAPRVSGQSALEGGRVVSLRTGRFYPQEITLILSSFRD